MDLEQIIKRIAEEVYGQIHAEQQKSGGAASAGSFGGEEWILCRMKPNMSIGDVKAACDAVKSGKAKTLCIPQWFVDYAVGQLKGSGVKIGTIVGLPGGSTSSFAKYAEVKQAVASGAEVIMIPVNMQLCAVGEWGAAKNDLAESMVPCKGKAAVYAIVETDSLSGDLLNTVAELCSSCGVDMVMLSAVVGGRTVDTQVQAVKSKGIRTGVYGGVTSATQSGYARAGATCFAAAQI